MKKQIIVLTSVVTVLFSGVLFAQEDNGQAGGFLRYGVGGRALGMGRAFTAVADDASGVYWNPAGILGADRIDITSMYANLFYDSQYAHFGMVIPRPLANTRDPFLGFLFGRDVSIGFGWVGLSMVGFEQRTEFCEYLGDFGIQENAFLFSWAREFLPSWGVFRTGFTLTFAGQHYSGLEAASTISPASHENRNTVGADIGFTFKPIHAPLFNIISLKYLLPLTFGCTVENALQPRWSGHEADRFPRSFRFGMSYRWVLRDWIPDSWGSFKSLFADCEILTTFDRHYLSGQKDGVYAGMEIVIPVSDNGITLYPRAGVNNQTEKRSLGLGLELPFSSNALLRIDYAYGDHPYLSGDNRFFLTIKTGADRGHNYFFNNVLSKELEREERIHDLYEVLAAYPNENVSKAVNFLIREDTTRVSRYLELAGGILWAEALFREARDNIARDEWGAGRRKAVSAADEYRGVYLDPDETMNYGQTLDYGEALIIAGSPDSALTVLSALSDSSWKWLHLQGVCKLALRDTSGAERFFREAAKFITDSTRTELADEQDYFTKRAISAMEYAVTLIHKENYLPAIRYLHIVQQQMQKMLGRDYPHYPPYYDRLLNDDAQYLIGLATILSGDFKRGIAELQKTNLLYFNSTYGIRAANYTDSFVDLYRNGNFSSIRAEATVMLQQYLQERDWLAF
ncbi:hypothetical protein JXO52_14110 [bacterium]|nr:hypothetical protein [bacterium]